MTGAANRSVWIRPVHGGSNPFTVRFAEAIAAEGLAVGELPGSPLRLPRGEGVLIFHWPNEFFKHGGLRADLRTRLMVARLSAGKRRDRQKLLWVVHNIVPHEMANAFNSARIDFFRLLDGLVFLSSDSRTQLLEVFPTLRETPYLITRHADYRLDNQSPPTLPCRRDGPARLGMFGHVRRYKQPERLARLVAALGESTLLIAGQCQDATLRSELIGIAGGCDRITLRLDHLDNAELEALTDGIDAVVLPYRAILNSGSALHALTRWRPVVAPRLGSLGELQRDAGEDWLHLYDGECDTAVLEHALAWARAERLTPPCLTCYDWDIIGRELAEFIQSLAWSRE